MNTKQPISLPDAAAAQKEKSLFARIGERIEKMLARNKVEIDRRRPVKDGYPKTGTGKRQGARVLMQLRNSFGYPYAASDKCIAAIEARKVAA